MSAALLFGVLLAQTVGATSESTEAAQLARIRKALVELPALETRQVERGDRPVFRLSVIGRKPDQPLWNDWWVVPSYVRPPMSPYHYEFLGQVTPESFRASVLYPGAPTTPFGDVGIAVPLVPIFEATAKGIARLNRRRREQAAREEMRALEELKNAKIRSRPARFVRAGAATPNRACRSGGRRRDANAAVGISVTHFRRKASSATPHRAHLRGGAGARSSQTGKRKAAAPRSSSRIDPEGLAAFAPVPIR